MENIENVNDEITFEESLKKLELLIEVMEKGNIPLDNLVDNYNQGKKLFEICQKKLKDAEIKISNSSKISENIILETFEKKLHNNNVFIAKNKIS